MCHHGEGTIGLLNFVIFAGGLFVGHVGGMFADRAKRFPRSVTPLAVALFALGAMVCVLAMALPPLGVSIL